jgi:hypothetical protein
MKKIAIALCLMISAVTAYAAPAAPGKVDLIVKTGSNSKSVYSQLFTEIQSVCSVPVLQDSPASGSIQALDDLLSNQANLAFVQSDVIIGRKTIENDSQVDNVRVFMPMFTSELHIVTASTNTSVNRFTDLFQKKVGAYGGSYITARILFGATNIRPFSLVQYPNEDTMIQAIKRGEIDVGMGVAGQPVAWVKELSGREFKLVPFDRADVLGKLGSYSQANLRYPNLSATTVPTVAVRIDMITYNYKSQTKINDLTKLKKCIAAHIDDLRETTGNHPKWQEIDPNAKVKSWPMFNAGK